MNGTSKYNPRMNIYDPGQPGHEKYEINPNCAHRNFTKEIFHGQRTGDYVCTECREIFSPAQHREIMKKHEAEKG